jgi:hypothetical protein
MMERDSMAGGKTWLAFSEVSSIISFASSLLFSFWSLSGVKETSCTGWPVLGDCFSDLRDQIDLDPVLLRDSLRWSSCRSISA